MTMTISGSGTITGISQGGLNDNIITQSELANTGVAGNGPAFHAYGNANQSVTSGVETKAQINTKTFDTANCFDATTNYRFTPNVAGYYFVYGNAGTYSTSGSLNETNTTLKKNGTTVVNVGNRMGSGVYNFGEASCLMYMNGSTDYVELYGYASGGTTIFAANAGNTLYFGGFMIRAA